MTSSTLRRCGAAALAGGLVASGLALGGPAPTAYAHASDPVPSGLAADWLAGELVDGALASPFGGADWGLTVDAGFALKEATGHETEVAAITDALAANSDSYISYTYTFEGHDYAGRVAGATAKLAAYAEAAGADPTSFGGTDLIAELEDLVRASGRIEDEAFVDGQTDIHSDYSNVIRQSYAARALSDAGSSQADAAIDFLLEQQCGAGWFRQDFTRPEDDTNPYNSPPATDGGCVGGSDAPNVDSTALAVIQLLPLAAGDATVAAAVSDAVAWLVGHQRSNGSFDDGGTIPPNANSTGVAGWALSEAGEHDAAEQAAAWLRGLQFSGTRCDGQAKDELGAIAYDHAGLKAARTAEIDRAKVQRAVTQSIPALLAAPASDGALGLRAPSFLDGGGTAAIRVRGVALGETACVGIGRFTRRVVGDVDGRSVAEVPVPDRAGPVAVVVRTADEAVGTEGLVLAAKQLPVDVREQVAPRGEQRVEVTGLASGERVVVRQDGSIVARGRAGTSGDFVTKFDAPGARGLHRLKVTGQFPDRVGRSSYRVG